MLFNLKKIIAYQAIWRTPTILSNAYFVNNANLEVFLYAKKTTHPELRMSGPT